MPSLAPAPVQVPVEPPVSQPEPQTYIPPAYDLPADPAAGEPEVPVIPAPISPVAPAIAKVRFVDRFKNRTPKPAPVVEPVVDELPPLPVFPDPDTEMETPEPEIKPARVSWQDRDAAVAVDRGAREFQFRLSYGGIIAIGFILLMILAIAFVAGRQLSSDTAINDDSAAARKTAQNKSATSGMMAAVAPATASQVRSDVMVVTPRTIKQTDAAAPAVAQTAPALPIKATRDIGMLYVVIQSYADEETAQKACSFVNKSGIPCSLVQGLTDWAPRDWYSVVGLQPFTRHDPGLAEYERVIANLGVRFTTKAYNQFQPQAYTWRADSDDQQP